MPPDDGFEFLNRHVEVSRETFSKFLLYKDLLLKWQAKINLVGDDTIADLWGRHFLDSIQLMPLLPKTKKPIVDFGTGAGFPGMVLAIMGIPNIHLIESDQKKISFLKEAARITQADVKIHSGRVENTKIHEAGVVTARALAPLSQLLEYTFPHVSHETICLFPKGKNWDMEIKDAQTKWQFDYQTTPSITDPNAIILSISHLERK